MDSGAFRSCVRALAAAAVLAMAACGDVIARQYEYEEELYLSLDGTATINVNASVAALVALRGATLDVDSRARLDRAAIRRLFTAPGVEVVRVSDSRRDGRRFVHVSLAVDDVRRLSAVAPFSWSKYELRDRGELVEYRQIVSKSARKPVGSVGWTGEELVAFRMHIPSEIPWHNSPKPAQRGNILEWEQRLRERLDGVPLDLRVSMEPRSILYSTLILFASTVVAVALTFALVVWLVARRGRAAAAAEPVS